MQLPTTLSLGNVDISAITNAIQQLATRLAQAEDRAIALTKVVEHQQEEMKQIVERAETTQDQFSNLYDAMQASLAKLTVLQETSYEKSKALSESIRIDKQFESIQKKLQELQETKVNIDSEELAQQVQKLATDASSSALYKFERDQKNWVLEQSKVTEERWSKNLAIKENETSQALELKFQYMLQKTEELSHREQTLRREVDNNHSSSINLFRAMCLKLDTHEKHVVNAEQTSFKRQDWLKERFEVFLELCIGTTWDELALRFPDSHPLLRNGARKWLFVPFSEVLVQEDASRNKRYIENYADWRRLQSTSSRLLTGVGEVLRVLEQSDQQICALVNEESANRKIACVKAEDQHRQDAAANEGMLRRYFSDSLTTADCVAPLSLASMQFLAATPLFTLMSRSIVGQAESITGESMKQFHADFSHQLSQLSKEMRGKSSISGLEETIKQVASRETQSQLSALQESIERLTTDHVGKADVEELLRMKADTSISDRKADEGYVRYIETELRATIASESKKTLAAAHEATTHKLSEISQNMVLRHDPRVKALFSVAEELPGILQFIKGQSKATVTAVPVTGPKTCLTCYHPVEQEGAEDSSTADSQQLRQRIQEQIHERQMRPASGARKSSAEAATVPQSQFRMKDWADSIEKRATTKTPKPPRL